MKVSPVKQYNFGRSALQLLSRSQSAESATENDDSMFLRHFVRPRTQPRRSPETRGWLRAPAEVPAGGGNRWIQVLGFLQRPRAATDLRRPWDQAICRSQRGSRS